MANPATHEPPLLAVAGLRREFPAGEETLVVLKDIDLTIHAGEMVAIVGASGSGKSTLMNILGCLDRPTAGHYRIRGRETSALDSDELAELRREHFGFIFQRYHLLPELTAIGNVEIPAVYAGTALAEREERATGLLARLGMADRLSHKPGQLSGGQQQRVSIARALMNGAEVILADEPTGALDSRSGEEVLNILRELNRTGKTVIIVTHDMSVARRAQRIVEIRDGAIVADRATEPQEQEQQETQERQERQEREDGREQAAAADSAKPQSARKPVFAALDRLGEAFRMAFLSMRAHKLRTFLTMLGIIIGIASVVSVVALGAGSRQQVIANISSLGTNTLEIFAGRDFGDTRSGRITTLVVADSDALATQSYVAAVTPTVSANELLRFGSVSANAMVNGVGEQYFDARGVKLAEGQFFDAESVRTRAQDAVIDENARKALFADLPGSPVGRAILIGKMPARIVGVTQPQQGGFGSSQNPSVYLPYTTVQTRLTGNTVLRSIAVRIADDVPTALAEQASTAFMLQRHGVKDFFILNTDDIRQTITATTETLTLLISAIALISLLVGGIGVMNIMLVTVSERVGEIGVRMAVGARQGDIMQQFLIEAIVVCFIGGLGGVGLSLAFGAIFELAGAGFRLIYSSGAIVASLLCSTAIGIAFGYLPARSAARLDPVVALSRN